jgi:hypothetical protein
MAICLSSYYPLIFKDTERKGAGRQACQKYGLSPFIDGSCRREPDFESDYPSITALCRTYQFAPRRKKGDIIIYISCKDKYDLPGSPNEPHWRFAAILKVIERRESHREAAEWYKKKGIDIPRNCMIKDTKPCPLDQTLPLPSKFKTLREWDLSYWKRARVYPVFLICDKSQYINLKDPPAITKKIMYEIFGHTRSGRTRGTQNPFCQITQEQLNNLKRFYGI